MNTPINAAALALAATRNIETGLVDDNSLTYYTNHSVALAKAVKAMHQRGEIEIARDLYREFCEARTNAENIERRIG